MYLVNFYMQVISIKMIVALGQILLIKNISSFERNIVFGQLSFQHMVEGYNYLVPTSYAFENEFNYFGNYFVLFLQHVEFKFIC